MGFIGVSTNPKLTHKIATQLFAKTESRGIDAAGFYGVNEQGQIAYHKQPGKSSQLVGQAVWKSLEYFKLDLLLCHCRAATTGMGSPMVNKNNHPFTSTSRNIGLIHNGKIPETDYDNLKKRFEVRTNCDSELFLRIFEGGERHAAPEDDSLKQRLFGIRDIWSYAHKAFMAVAIGERVDEHERHLWLCHNKHRPLWLVDLRDYLGQIFFCSTPEIWRAAINDFPSTRQLAKVKIKLIDLPVEQVWRLSIDKEHPTVTDDHLLKFKVETGSYKSWDHKAETIKVVDREPVAHVVTLLDHNDEDAEKKRLKLEYSHRHNYDDFDYGDYGGLPVATGGKSFCGANRIGITDNATPTTTRPVLVATPITDIDETFFEEEEIITRVSDGAVIYHVKHHAKETAMSQLAAAVVDLPDHVQDPSDLILDDIDTEVISEQEIIKVMLDELDKYCKTIRELANSIAVDAVKCQKEGFLAKDDLEMLNAALAEISDNLGNITTTLNGV